jgi:hypothetical protein
MIKGFEELTEWYTSSDELSEKRISVEDLINLDDFMCANRMEYVVVGTMGLYLHGLVPDNYVVKNIDILVSSSCDDYKRICSCLRQVEENCYSTYDLYDYDRSSVLREGTDYAIKLIDNVNVSVTILNYLIDSSHFHSFTIRGRSIPVLNVYEILKHKYSQRRTKDYEFHIAMQNKLSKFLEVDYVLRNLKQMSQPPEL